MSRRFSNSHRFRRPGRWAAVAVGALLIASCSSNSSELPSGSATPDTAGPAGSVVEVETAESPVIEPPTNEPDAAPQTRTVEHALGTSDIPVTPERIAVVGRRGTLPILLDLGFEPVGALDASFIFGQPFHPLVTERTDEIGVEPIARGDSGPNVEQVALLAPDLIIGNVRDFEQVQDELPQIAPVVGLRWDFADPLANVATIGGLMGVEDQAAALVADFDAEFATATEVTPSPGTVSIAGLFGVEDLRIYRSANLLGGLIVGFGGQIVPTDADLPLDPADPEVNRVSLENIELLSGDRLISFVNFGSESREGYEEIVSSPLVRALPAFESGRVLEVDPQLVFGTAGVTGLRVVVSQLVDFFAEA